MLLCLYRGVQAVPVPAVRAPPAGYRVYEHDLAVDDDVVYGEAKQQVGVQKLMHLAREITPPRHLPPQRLGVAAPPLQGRAVMAALGTAQTCVQVGQVEERSEAVLDELVAGVRQGDGPASGVDDVVEAALEVAVRLAGGDLRPDLPEQPTVGGQLLDDVLVLMVGQRQTRQQGTSPSGREIGPPELGRYIGGDGGLPAD